MVVKYCDRCGTRSEREPIQINGSSYDLCDCCEQELGTAVRGFICRLNYTETAERPLVWHHEPPTEAGIYLCKIAGKDGQRVSLLRWNAKLRTWYRLASTVTEKGTVLRWMEIPEDEEE